MQEKIKKTLYIPPWIGQLLDTEGERYDGPGVVAAAAIYGFCALDHDAQIAALAAFREREIKEVYAQNNDEAAAVALFEEVAALIKSDKSGARILSQAAGDALRVLFEDLGPDYIAKIQADEVVSGAEADATSQQQKRGPGSSKSA